MEKNFRDSNRWDNIVIRIVTDIVRVDWMIAGPFVRTRGKSELRRAGWSLTATGGDPKESATENIPPRSFSG